MGMKEKLRGSSMIATFLPNIIVFIQSMYVCVRLTLLLQSQLLGISYYHRA